VLVQSTAAGKAPQARDAQDFLDVAGRKAVELRSQDSRRRLSPINSGTAEGGYLHMTPGQPAGLSLHHESFISRGLGICDLPDHTAEQIAAFDAAVDRGPVKSSSLAVEGDGTGWVASVHSIGELE
jgi:hypothetical protein